MPPSRSITMSIHYKEEAYGRYRIYVIIQEPPQISAEALFLTMVSLFTYRLSSQPMPRTRLVRVKESLTSGSVEVTRS